MTSSGFVDFCSAVHRALGKGQHVEADQRVGQFWVNMLRRVRPDLADRLTADKPYDPFYEDGRVSTFLIWLQENW